MKKKYVYVYSDLSVRLGGKPRQRDLKREARNELTILCINEDGVVHGVRGQSEIRDDSFDDMKLKYVPKLESIANRKGESLR